jgi:ferredoxin-NADP reductase/DMSO/TMAO reductase YedYZ heme-binding membrane subunit
MTTLAAPPRARSPLAGPSPREDNIRFAKFVLLVNGLIPGALLAWDYFHGSLGADPPNFVVRTTGMITLVFLALSLLVTPLRKLTGFAPLFHFRRTLGLYAFFYGLVHFFSYFALEQYYNLAHTFAEIFMRLYLFIGYMALMLMIPLAATSFNATIKRLGPRRWKLLHSLTYLICTLGAIHFFLLQKSDKRLPILFFAIFGILFAYRLLAWALKPRTHAATTAADTGRWMGTLRVDRITSETPNVRTFRLVPTAGAALPFQYKPGQHLSLTLPIDGKNVYRSYTIASSPSRPGCCELTIKREDMGTASRHIHALKPGDTLAITAPSGRFTFTGENANAVALLAAGVGITPLMSILRYLTDRRWGGQIYLVYANKTQSDIIFKKELETLAAQHPNLHITHTLTRDTDPLWPGLRGRITPDLLTSTIPNLQQTPFYICGPTEMITATSALLRSLNVPEKNIFTESFGVLPSPIDYATAAAAFTVTFARSHKSAPVPNTKPLLLAAEELNVPIESECRSGSCGRCKCKLLAGSVTMANDEALSPADKRNGYILACQARPTADTTIDA